MTYYIVSNGTDYGALEAGKPMPRGFRMSGGGKTYDSKEACQEWVDEELYFLEMAAAAREGVPT